MKVTLDKTQQFWIPTLLMLESRKVNGKTAVLLSAGVNAMINAWSVHQRGGLVGRFTAGASDVTITTLATNKNNTVLVTGDSSGYVKTWDIENYCLENATDENEVDGYRPSTMETLIEKVQRARANGGSIDMRPRKSFIEVANDANRYLARRNSRVRASIFDSRKPSAAMGGLLGLEEDDIMFRKSVRSKEGKSPLSQVNKTPPKIIKGFKAHTKAISSMCINESRNVLITGSSDCSVRVFTMCGRYIGTFGQKNFWKLDDHVMDLSKLPQLIPEDVRRVASANTLKTIKGGIHSQWKTVKNALAFLQSTTTSSVPKEDEDEEDSGEKSETTATTLQVDPSLRPRKSLLPNIDAGSGLTVRRKSSIAGTVPRRPSMTTVWVDDMPMKTIMEFQSNQKVEKCFQKIMEHGVQSGVYDKHAWSQRYRRERAPLKANYERTNAPGEGPRPPLAPVAQVSAAEAGPSTFTVTKHNPVRWEAKHAIVYRKSFS